MLDRLLTRWSSLAGWLSRGVLAQQPAPPRPKVLAFFTVAASSITVLFAQQAMRAFGGRAGDGGYAFTATSDWDA